MNFLIVPKEKKKGQESQIESEHICTTKMDTALNQNNLYFFISFRPFSFVFELFTDKIKKMDNNDGSDLSWWNVAEASVFVFIAGIKQHIKLSQIFFFWFNSI